MQEWSLDFITTSLYFDRIYLAKAGGVFDLVFMKSCKYLHTSALVHFFDYAGNFAFSIMWNSSGSAWCEGSLEIKIGIVEYIQYTFNRRRNDDVISIE